MQLKKKVLNLLNEGMTRREVALELDEPLCNVKAIAYREKVGWLPKKLNCRICGIEFAQTSPVTVCCSDECRAKNRQQQKAPKKKLYKCRICGKQYRRWRNNNKDMICGVACEKKKTKEKERIRNDEIWWLREIQGLTFVRIGQIFDMTKESARYYYRKRRLEKQLTGGA